MWTPATREQHSRSDLRYSTDLTDAEWAVIEPLLPSANPLGRPRLWSLGDIVNGIFFVLRGGVPWRLLPKDLPPKSTVYGYFSAWRDDGLFASINHHLVMLDRERVGRDASPTAAVLDSQSVKTTESGGPRGYDAGKKVKGRKRQALVDTDGRALMLDPQPADVQDRDGAVPVLKQSRRSYPFIAKAFRRGLRRRQACERHPHRRRDRPQAARTGRLRGPSAPMGGRALLCLDQPQSTALERPGSHHRFRQGLPLRRVRHDAATSHRLQCLTSRTDSQTPRACSDILRRCWKSSGNGTALPGFPAAQAARLRLNGAATRSLSVPMTALSPATLPTRMQRIERALLLLAWCIELDGDVHVPLYEKFEAELVELRAVADVRTRAGARLAAYRRSGGRNAICDRNFSLSSSDGPLPYFGL